MSLKDPMQLTERQAELLRVIANCKTSTPRFVDLRDAMGMKESSRAVAFLMKPLVTKGAITRINKKIEITPKGHAVLDGTEPVVKINARNRAVVTSMCFKKPRVSRQIREVGGVRCDAPTRAKTGTPEKIEVLAARAESGLPLWVDGDSIECGVNPPDFARGFDNRLSVWMRDEDGFTPARSRRDKFMD